MFTLLRPQYNYTFDSRKHTLVNEETVHPKILDYWFINMQLAQCGHFAIYFCTFYMSKIFGGTCMPGTVFYPAVTASAFILTTFILVTSVTTIVFSVTPLFPRHTLTSVTARNHALQTANSYKK